MMVLISRSRNYVLVEYGTKKAEFVKYVKMSANQFKVNCGISDYLINLCEM